MTLRQECVALLLGDDLKLSYVVCKDDGDLVFGEDTFEDEGWGGFMGFHDWLRASTRRNEIVGVRFWPHERASLPSAAVDGKPYLEWYHDGRGIIVWFGEDRDFDPAISGDQSFRVSRVVRSRATGRIALILDQDDLTAEELESIGSTVSREVARWAEQKA